MRYYRYLYLGEDLKEKKEKIIGKIERGKLTWDIHIVTLPVGEKNQLEIYACNQFLQRDYPKMDFFVVGIVKGYENAIELVEEIAKQVYNETRSADIRSYILKKEQEG
ncbi:MAG: hypothetical protein K1W34_15830 [Lachnospiraceae bacterium]